MSLLEALKNRKELVFLVAILLLAFVIRIIPYGSDSYDYDTYVHYSVVQQAIERGELPLKNSLDSCPDGIKATHPLGFYLLPWIIGHIINIKLSFALSSVFFGVLTILLLYILLKKTIGTRAALIGVSFLAICSGHIVRSHALVYRGENFVLPSLILSLIFGFLFLTTEKKLLYSILAGIISASAILFWPGYHYALVIYALSLIFFITWNFIKGKEINANVNYSIISLVVQAIFVFIFIYLFSIQLNNTIPSYFPLAISLSASAFLFLLKISSKYLETSKKKLFFLGAIGLILLIIALIKFTLIISALSGFGLIKPSGEFYKNIAELVPINLNIIYMMFWIIPIFSLLGLCLFFFQFDDKEAFLLAAVLSSAYLLTTTIRFIFLGSIFFIPLIGIFFDYIIRWKKKLGYALLIGLFLVAIFYQNPFTQYTNSQINQDMLSSFNYFEANAGESACLATMPDWGGMAQYYTKKSTYISSTNQNFDRFNKLAGFLLTNQTLEKSSINIPGLYIGIMPEDLLKLKAIIAASEIEGLQRDLLYVQSKQESSDFDDYSLTSQEKEGYIARVYNNGTTQVKKSKNSNTIYVKNVYIDINGKVSKSTKENAEDNGCVFLSSYANAYFNENLCNTNLMKMLVQDKIPGLEFWHSKGNARIYKVA